MKMVKKLSLLAMAIVIAGCNEKVSPELQESNSTTPDTDGGPTIVPDEYYFKLTNTAPVLLNYKLHKTGSGNRSAPCEVRSTSQLDNDTFRANPAAMDISCYLEAEELSLRAGGLSFEIEASPNTCEFIEYTPFSYFNKMPGDSTSTYTKINCMNEETTSAHAADAATTAGIDIIWPDAGGAGVPGPAACNQYLSQSGLLATTRQPIVLNEDDTENLFCRFNYTDDGGEKCDIGEVTVQDLQVTFDTVLADTNGKAAGRAALIADYSDGSDDDGAGPDDGTAAILADEQTAIENNVGADYTPAYNTAYNNTAPKYKVVTRKIKCGGSVGNCVDGPLKQHGELKGTRGSIIQTAEFDKVIKIKQDYKNLLPNGQGNYYYANFRRDLANVNLDYGDSTHTELSPYTPAYTGAFSSPAFGKAFDPNIMERYSRGIVPDNSAFILSATFDAAAPFSIWESNSTQENKFVAKPLAMEPFVGLRTLTASGTVAKEYYTSPYYTFYCLDTAFDRKARIRLLVRDWDRIFPNDANLELISDINLGTNARQDLQYFVEDPDSHDDINDFNDLLDWDDLIWTIRDDSTPLIFYRPAPSSNDTDGWFNTDFFPRYAQDPEED